VFTVIFLSRAARRIFERSKTFFDPFVDSGEIAFCDWNDSAGAISLQQSLPQLAEVIRGKAAWRAVVVDHAAGESQGARDVENPFDFLDNREVRLNIVDSPHALVRIAHQLLGYPALTARDFEPVVSYRGPAGARVEHQTEGGDFQDALRTLGQTHSDVRVEYRELPYPAVERALHEELRARYRMKEVPPSEVLFLSTRSRVDTTEQRQLQRAWRTQAEQHSSRFVERNDYPAACRFAVYDLLNPENSGYEQDELRFWTSVLTVAVNVLPPSGFQAERVYRLAVDFSEPALGELLNAHMGQLTALREHLDLLIETPSYTPETDVRELMRTETVPVQFERGGNDLVVRTAGYGLASDWPDAESSRWADDFEALQLNADQFIRRPRRVVSRAVSETRQMIRHSIVNDHALSEMDRDEIRDELSKRIGHLVVPATTQILDRRRLVELLEQENDGVRRLLGGRMRIQMVAVVSLVVLLAWVVSFVPYLIQAAVSDNAIMQWSFFVVAAVIVVIAAVSIATLLWMRRRLVQRLHEVNSRMRGFVNDVNAGAQVFGEYLSQVATYMQARAVLIGADRMQGRTRVRRELYRTVRGRANGVIEAEKKIVTSLGQPLNIRRVPGGVSGLDIENSHQVGSFFRFPISTGTAAFNESGERIAAPYDFVERLSLERLRLFERDARAVDAPDSIPAGEAD
jgi:hypothetical protein